MNALKFCQRQVWIGNILHQGSFHRRVNYRQRNGSWTGKNNTVLLSFSKTWNSYLTWIPVPTDENISLQKELEPSSPGLGKVEYLGSHHKQSRNKIQDLYMPPPLLLPLQPIPLCTLHTQSLGSCTWLTYWEHPKSTREEHAQLLGEVFPSP